MKNDILKIIDNKSYIKNYDVSKILNMHLVNVFNYYECSLLSTKFFIIEIKDNKESLQNIEKGLFIVKEKLKKEVVLYLENISTYEYKKLIIDGIPFITGEGNYFLPFLALKLEIKSNNNLTKKFGDKFTIGGQLLFLYLLYSNDNKFTMKEIIDKLKINEMTFSRAVNDLINKKLLNYEMTGKTGRMKIYYIQDKKIYFKEGRNFLFSPVINEVYISNKYNVSTMMKAGITALSENTMINNDKFNTYAIYKKEYDNIAKYVVDYRIGIDNNYDKVLLLKYDPLVLTLNGSMDPITISLTIKEKDERIDMAINELLSKQKWYEE